MKKNGAVSTEAVVAGGIPILRTLVAPLASDKITRVLGVVNGTFNFMMTKMVEEGWSYEDALQFRVLLKVTRLTTLDGIDAAYKWSSANLLSVWDIKFEDVSLP